MRSFLNAIKQAMFHSFFVFMLLHVLAQNTYALTPYSNRALDELEKEFVQEINQSIQVERSPVLNLYLNHIGKRLGEVGHIPNVHFFIVKSHEINAFAGPGGHIGVNTALILASKSESELAAVMAHELAHVRQHHLYSMMEHQSQMRIPLLASMLASLALGLVNPALGNGALMASMGSMAQDSINFTRAKEKEADRIGIAMLTEAGFDPRAMASFFKKLQQNSRYYYTANVPAILRSHPLDDERIAEADNRSLHLPAKAYPSSLEYQLFKETIRVHSGLSGQEANGQRLSDFYQLGCKEGIACQYGKAMQQLSLNQLDKAKERLQPLLEKDHDNLFFQLAMAEVEIGKKQFDKANSRLQSLQASFPNNYAILRAYAHSLLSSGQALHATSILLKAQRQFKKDLPICEELAKAESEAGRKAYAYFTESQCQLLQGRTREAMRQLKNVIKLSKHDPYLLARANAMIEEIQFMRAGS